MILYVREIYPASLFETRKKYNVPVPMSRHPHLNSYIQDMILACRPDLEKGDVETMTLVVLNKNQVPIERFVFEINTLIEVKDNGGQSSIGTMSVNDVELYLRAFLLKISVCDAMLKPNPKGCTFSLVIQLHDGINTPTQTNEGFPWIPAEPSEQPMGMPRADLMMLKSFDTGLLKVQLYVEESNMDEKYTGKEFGILSSDQSPTRRR
ncbi:DNA-binding protein [Basidiobolus meristosporus CBS 931.73]|uniref:DNA-binding protein n=1 Tax=Basidiobolus meristosporus CBS 931.73 TaxID=1314790 RepID=A0A1Y1Z3F3_9FUNG|nr:DNA-binding protein [Basidiobolus meristosporus CBS 931.73]|eukprot:ORY04811.1 DNA-binding protein [Basidiobolus meristosporus CBS 931.73]